MESKIKNHLSTGVGIMIKQLQAMLNCRHKWKEHGEGYLCEECYCYTGTDKDLSKLIKQELTTKKK